MDHLVVNLYLKAAAGRNSNNNIVVFTFVRMFVLSHVILDLVDLGPWTSLKIHVDVVPFVTRNWAALGNINVNWNVIPVHVRLV